MTFAHRHQPLSYDFRGGCRGRALCHADQGERGHPSAFLDFQSFLPETSANSHSKLLQEHSCAMLANMALNGTADPRRLTLCAP